MKISILGYGNLARGVESAIRQNDDMELKYVFTRRDPSTVSVKTPGVEVKSVDDILKYKDEQKLKADACFSLRIPILPPWVPGMALVLQARVRTCPGTSARSYLLKRQV